MAFNGTPVASPTFTGSGGPVTGSGSVAFNGTTQYINLGFPHPGNFASGNGSWTVQGWVKTSTTPAATKVIVGTLQRDDSGSGWYVGINSSGNIVAAIDPSGITSTNSIHDNAWHHFALVTVNGELSTLYLDGVSVGTPVTTLYAGPQTLSTGAVIADGTCRIGAFGTTGSPSNFFTGSVSEVSYHDYAVYTSNFTPPTVALAASVLGTVALYHLSADANDSNVQFTVSTVTLTNGDSMNILTPVAGVSNPTDIVHILHGYTGTYTSFNTSPQAFSMVARLCQAGYLVYVPDGAQNSWGNAAGLTGHLQGYQYMTANYAVRNVYGIGQSMGGQVSLLSVANGNIPFKGLYLQVPVCNLLDIYTYGTAGIISSINTAYNIPGGGSYAVQTAGHDPLLISASSYINHCKNFRFIYDPGNDLTVNQFNSSVPMSSLLIGHGAYEVSAVSYGGGHSPAGAGNGSGIAAKLGGSVMQPADILAFFTRASTAQGVVSVVSTGTTTITVDGPTGRTDLYAILSNSKTDNPYSGSISSAYYTTGSVYETYNSAHWSAYAIALTETGLGTGVYTAAVPTAAKSAMVYQRVYARSLSTAATTDTLLAATALTGSGGGSGSNGFQWVMGLTC